MYMFSGRLTLCDYIQFNKFHYRNSLFCKIILPLCAIVCGIASALIFIVLSKLSKIETEMVLSIITDRKIILLFSIFIFTIFFILVYKNYIIPKIYKKHYDANKMMDEMKNFIITDESITISGKSESVVLNNDNINKILFDNDSIYVYTALNMAHIIKKDFLDNENRFNELKQLVTNHYVDKK